MINKVLLGECWLTLDIQNSFKFCGYPGNGGEFPEPPLSFGRNRVPHAGGRIKQSWYWTL